MMSRPPNGLKSTLNPHQPMCSIKWLIYPPQPFCWHAKSKPHQTVTSFDPRSNQTKALSMSSTHQITIPISRIQLTGGCWPAAAISPLKPTGTTTCRTTAKALLYRLETCTTTKREHIQTCTTSKSLASPDIHSSSNRAKINKVLKICLKLSHN